MSLIAAKKKEEKLVKPAQPTKPVAAPAGELLSPLVTNSLTYHYYLQPLSPRPTEPDVEHAEDVVVDAGEPAAHHVRVEIVSPTKMAIAPANPVVEDPAEAVNVEETAEKEDAELLVHLDVAAA